MVGDEFINHLRLNDAQLHSVIRRLNDRAAMADKGTPRPAEAPKGDAKPSRSRSNRRRQRRFAYESTGILGIVDHPGGTTAKIIVCGRNLSKGGLSFLHGAFLHPGSRCRFILTKLDGTRHTVTGEVVNCRHVDGKLHEVGMRFDEQVDPTLFVPCADSADLPDPPDLTIVAVLVSTDDSVIARFTELFAGTRAKLTTVADPEKAAAHAKSAHATVVILDWLVPAHGGARGVEELARAKAFKHIIVAVDEADAATLSAARTAGAHLIIAAGDDPRAIIELLAALPTSAGGPLLFSALENEAGRAADVSTCIEELNQVAYALDAAVRDQKLPVCLSLCKAIQETASKCGFRDLATATRQAIARAQSAKSFGPAKPEFVAVAAACRRLSLKRAA